MSNYTLEAMYETQKAFDARIVAEKRLEGQDLLTKKVLALQVEIAELANEWRGFKMWSNDQTMRREKALEELADCVSFVLSIMNELELAPDQLRIYDDSLNGDTEDVFIEMMYLAAAIRYRKTREAKIQELRALCFCIFALAEQRLDFDFDEIAVAYYAKNKINHDRQASGY